MNDRRVDHREARFAEPIQVGDVTITPLVEVRLTLRGEAPPGGTGAIEPLGVLVEGPDGVQAVGLDGDELPTAGPTRSVDDPRDRAPSGG